MLNHFYPLIDPKIAMEIQIPDQKSMDSIFAPGYNSSPVGIYDNTDLPEVIFYADGTVVVYVGAKCPVNDNCVIRKVEIKHIENIRPSKTKTEPGYGNIYVP